MDLLTAFQIAKNYKLRAPKGFYEILLPDLMDIVGKGGCGPGNKGDYLVPDTIYGLNVKPACVIHDTRYASVSNDNEQYEADKEFLYNMFTLIDKQTKWAFLRWARHRRALKMYEAVRLGGSKFIKN